MGMVEEQDRAPMGGREMEAARPSESITFSAGISSMRRFQRASQSMTQ